MSKKEQPHTPITPAEESGPESAQTPLSPDDRDSSEDATVVDVRVQGEEPRAQEEAVAAEEVSEEDRLQARVAELEDRLLRAAADFDNFKKRIARQVEDSIRTANDKLLVELLEVVDSLERALQHSHENTDLDGFRTGTKLILDQILNMLEKYDVKPIEAMGRPFDPNLHEALMQVESEDHPDGVVALEIARGYRQGNRVLRHAKVGVSQGPPRAESKESLE